MLEVVRRRISAHLAVTRAEGAASAFLAAVALRQLLRCSACSALRPNGQLVRGYSLPVSAVVARQQLSHQRGGSDGRTSATTQIVKTLHSCLDATRLYRACDAAMRLASASHDFVQLGVRKTLRTPRGAVALLPRRGLRPGCNIQHHGSTGAPRARWARPELGKDPDVTPDQHCEEWRGLLRDRAFRRGAASAHTTD